MKLFDKVGHIITSMAAVIFVLLLIIMAMVFFSHTLFMEALPASMAVWEKISAAWLLAFGWEFTVLITTCNTKHINRRIPAIMAVCSGVILLFFVQAFDSTQPGLILCQRWFVGMLIAAINFIYADLFYLKWIEYTYGISLPGKINELHSSVNELQSALTHAESKLSELEGLKSFRVKVTKELTCPHCKVEQISYGTLHAHKGHCVSNPKNIAKG